MHIKVTSRTLLFTGNLCFKLKLNTRAMENIFAHKIYCFSKLSGKLNPSSGEQPDPAIYIQNNNLLKQLTRRKIQIINLEWWEVNCCIVTIRTRSEFMYQLTLRYLKNYRPTCFQNFENIMQNFVVMIQRMVSDTARSWGHKLFARPTRNPFVIANACMKVTFGFTYIPCRTLSVTK